MAGRRQVVGQVVDEASLRVVQASAHLEVAPLARPAPHNMLALAYQRRKLAPRRWQLWPQACMMTMQCRGVTCRCCGSFQGSRWGQMPWPISVLRQRYATLASTPCRIKTSKALLYRPSRQDRLAALKQTPPQSAAEPGWTVRVRVKASPKPQRLRSDTRSNRVSLTPCLRREGRWQQAPGALLLGAA